MTIYILSLFPEMFEGPFKHSILKIAQIKERVTIRMVNIRDFGIGNHKTVDDKPYGGGTGMIMRVDVLDNAIQSVKKNISKDNSVKTVLLDARGKTFNQSLAKKYSKLDNLILIAGHYEGVDERVNKLIDESVSIGDYVLTGGEIPAMVLTDAIVRLIPGVLKKGVTDSESFSSPTERITLEHPHYTRPRIYKNMKVPEILLAGNHSRTKEWKDTQAIKRTKRERPDLLQ